MGQKITDYPNEATDFTTDDKFDISQDNGGGSYESKWYSPLTLYKSVKFYLYDYFMPFFEVDIATMIALIAANDVVPNGRYHITDSVHGALYVYGVKTNTITEFAYLEREFDYWMPSAVGRYNLNSDIFLPADSTITDSHFSLLLRYLGGYFSRGMNIDINDAAQFPSQEVRLYCIDENRTSSAAIMMGSQDGGTTPSQTGYFGNYDAVNDIFVHDIVHFRTEVSSAIINTGTVVASVDIPECPLPPAGYAWEVLSANVWREAGSGYGTGALIQVGNFSLGRGQYWDNGVHYLRYTAENWAQLNRNDQGTNKTMLEDEKLKVFVTSVTATGTGKIVVHGTARLMKK